MIEISDPYSLVPSTVGYEQKLSAKELEMVDEDQIRTLVLFPKHMKPGRQTDGLDFRFNLMMMRCAPFLIPGQTITFISPRDLFYSIVGENIAQMGGGTLTQSIMLDDRLNGRKSDWDLLDYLLTLDEWKNVLVLIGERDFLAQVSEDHFRQIGIRFLDPLNSKGPAVPASYGMSVSLHTPITLFP